MLKTNTAYYTSPIGNLKLIATDKYVTSILFDDQTHEVDLSETTELLSKCSIQLHEYFSGTRTCFNLPLNQSGTGFQEKIWKQLIAIPYGKTISYSDLAVNFGDIKAIRAVAAANGKNKLCILIPCHRVIGKNRTLTGYSGGLWRKQWLLEHEAKYSLGVQQFSF